MFRGGLNYTDGRIGQQSDGEYFWLSNGDLTNAGIKPTTAPIKLGQFPATIQGQRIAGNYSIVIAGGKCYTADLRLATPIYTAIVGFQLDEDVEHIYIELVPGSTVNNGRTLNTSTTVQNGVDLSSQFTSASIGCAIISDGINQPILLFAGGNFRSAQTYIQWTKTNREYMPLMILMKWDPENAILYAVTPDRKRLIRSVSGRPTDFMIIIDGNGDKLPSEIDGGANQVSHAVDYDDIVALSLYNTGNGSLLLGCVNNLYLVTPDLADTQYNEPTFIQRVIPQIACTGPYSIGNVRQDTWFIANKTLYNLASVVDPEGANDMFYNVMGVFDGLIQTADIGIAIAKLHTYVAINTIFGRGVLAFSNEFNVWASVDYPIFEDNEYISRLATGSVNNEDRLLATTQTAIYELYPSSGSYSTCSFIPLTLLSRAGQSDILLSSVSGVFTDLNESGTVSVNFYTNEKLTQTGVTDTITKSVYSDTAPPYFTRSIANDNSISAQNKQPIRGFSVSASYNWSFDATMVNNGYVGTENDNPISNQAKRG